MRALTVDDSKLVRRLVTRALQDMGFTVSEATNGEEALVSLLTDGPPELIILDWNMPVMDGLEFLKRMRKVDKFAPVKVVMLTARNEMEAVMTAVGAGANEYLMKPFTPDLLEDKIRMTGLSIPTDSQTAD